MATLAHTTQQDVQLLPRHAPHWSKRAHRFALFGAFVLGVVCASAFYPFFLSLGHSSSSDERVDFEFSVLGINTPRQDNKTLNVFVRWRYRPSSTQCPFSATDNTCIQYQLWMRSRILDITLHDFSELGVMAEWERVNLAICRAIWKEYPGQLEALSTSLHVNGDGRSAYERGAMPYEPGAHGTTCTIGDDQFAPISFYNRLPNLGPY